MTKDLFVSALAGFVGGLVGIVAIHSSFLPDANAQDFQPHIVSAGEFRVLDQEGQIRMSLTPSGITLSDGANRKRVILEVEPRTGLHILDEAGQPRAELFLFPGGDSHLYLHDSRKRLRTVIDPSELALIGENQSEVILDLDSRQKNTVRIRTRDRLGPALFFLNGDETLQAALGRLYLPSEETDEKPISSLLLYDDEGDLVWSAP